MICNAQRPLGTFHQDLGNHRLQHRGKLNADGSLLWERRSQYINRLGRTWVQGTENQVTGFRRGHRHLNA